MKVIQDFLNYLTVEKGYSQQTISTYRDSLESFQIFFRSLDDQLTWKVFPPMLSDVGWSLKWKGEEVPGL